MKYILFFALIITAVLLVDCTASKTAVPSEIKVKEMLFDYPEDMVADTAKQRFAKEFKKGSVLYGLTCSKCHTVTVDGKPVVPDFSLPQLMDYELRFQYPSHGDELKETNITHDELEWIVLFLRYKKKTNYSINEALLKR